jgi:hypothetical protein
MLDAFRYKRICYRSKGGPSYDRLKITMLNEDWWIGVSAFQAFAFQSESIPGPSTPAQGMSALSGLNSGLKSGCIGHEAIGGPQALTLWACHAK